MHILLVALLIAPGALAHPEPTASPPPPYDGGNPPGEIPPKLEPGRALDGVARREPVVLRDGILSEAPTLAVTPAGQVFVAFVAFDEQDRTERIWVRRAPSPEAALEPATAATEGARAWHPRLAAGPSGEVWLAWCGRADNPGRGDHATTVWARRLAPVADMPVALSEGGVRACDPELAIDEAGGVHAAWEEAPLADLSASRIRYRKLGGASELVSQGPFDRRPAILSRDGRVVLAWDSWVDRAPTGAEDPDYDVLLRERADGAWREIRPIDTSPGIQAAPALAWAPGGGLLLAYHSTESRGSLVKWWRLLRVRGATIERPAGDDPYATSHQLGEIQGTEFPALAASPGGQIFLVSRPSQGAYLHWLDGAKVRSADLTRSIWSARGMKSQLRFAPDGSLLVVRRAAREPVLERFLLETAPAPAEFQPWRPTPKPKPRAFTRGARETSVLFGDVHMHSAVSDGAGPPDEIYARAYARGLDFAALTDHDTVQGSRMAPSEHAEIEWLTDAFQRPGFTTLHAYEWTTAMLPRGSGHRNVYFRGYAPPIPYSRGTGHGDTRSLFNALRGELAFAVPHHIGWTGTDWENADEAIQRNVEIVSVHGVYDSPGGPIPVRGGMEGMFAGDGLRRGIRFGFLGGSDAHGLLFHHGIGRRRDPWGHGLTGLWLADRSREAIWDALHARAAFVTSGPRMTAALEVDGLSMGRQGLVPARPLLRARFRATGPLQEVVLFRDGDPVRSVDAAGRRELDLEWRDSVAAGPHSYFARALQRSDDGTLDLAWTSPVFAEAGAALLRNTHYYVALESDFAGLPADDLILDPAGRVLARVSSRFRRAVDVEGTGRLLDGRVINFAGRRGGRVRYAVTIHPHGRGSGDCALEPFRSAAVDPRVIELGSTIRIAESVGMRLPDGTFHDGLWRAEDGGGGIKHDRIDLFVGVREQGRVLESAGITHLKPLTVTVVSPRPESSCVGHPPR